MEERNFEFELKDLQRKRDELEDYYRQEKNHIEELDYEISNHRRKLEEMTHENKTANTDVGLQNIYDERESILMTMRRNQRDYDEYLDEKYRKEMAKLDDEEFEIKSKQSKENDNGKAEGFY